MAALEYKARDDHGRAHRGQESAHDENELRESLRARGLYLVTCRPATRRSHRFFGPRVSRRELIVFTYHLQTVVAAGIPLLVGLEDLARQTKNSGFRQVVEDVAHSVSGGSTLSQALARHPRVFPSMYEQMVAAGELSGQLPEVLERLTGVLEWQEDLRAQLRQLAAYPSFVVAALIGLVVLLLAFVVPRFEGILEGLQVELPWPTRALMSVSELLVAQAIPLIATLVVLAVGLPLALRSSNVRYVVDTMLLRVPVFGPLRLGMISSQIAHFLGAFTAAGIPVGQGLDSIANLVDNLRARVAIRRIRHQVLDGQTLAEAFAASALFPSLVLRMVSIGEETGALPESLRKAESYYNKEIPRRVQQIVDMTGPALTVVLACVLCFVVLAVLLPIYKMYAEL